MPIVRNIHLNVNPRQVLRREGVTRPRPGAESQARTFLDWAWRHLIEPAIAYEVYPVPPGGAGRTGPCRGRPLYLPRGGHGAPPLQQAFPFLARHSGGSRNPGGLADGLALAFPQAEEFAVAVCTIGPRLEQEVAACFGRHEPSRAVLLDGIGNAAVDALTVEACGLLAREAALRGFQTSSPLSPGMPGLDISEQTALVGLVPADDVGVSVTALGMMAPRKSASLVVGIGRHMPRWTQADMCARCQMKDTCRHSVHARLPTAPQPGAM